MGNYWKRVSEEEWGKSLDNKRCHWCGGKFNGYFWMDYTWGRLHFQGLCGECVEGILDSNRVPAEKRIASEN